MTDIHDDAQVTIPVRDLLKDIKDAQTAGFARLEKTLEAKADKADVARMEVRLDNHGERISTIEQEKRDALAVAKLREEHVETTWSRRNKIWVVVTGVLGIVGLFGGPILANMVIH